MQSFYEFLENFQKNSFFSWIRENFFIFQHSFIKKLMRL